MDRQYLMTPFHCSAKITGRTALAVKAQEAAPTIIPEWLGDYLSIWRLLSEQVLPLLAV